MTLFSLDIVFLDSTDNAQNLIFPALSHLSGHITIFQRSYSSCLLFPLLDFTLSTTPFSNEAHNILVNRALSLCKFHFTEHSSFSGSQPWPPVIKRCSLFMRRMAYRIQSQQKRCHQLYQNTGAQCFLDNIRYDPTPIPVNQFLVDHFVLFPFPARRGER